MNAAVIGRRDLLRLMGTSSVALATAGLTSGWAAGPQQAKSVATRKIPSSGEALPIVGLGTWQTFDVGPEPAALRPLEEVLQTFADMGGKVVDSSPMYGRSEEVVGTIANQLQLTDRLFLATKVWTSGKQDGIRQMEDSIRKLGRASIDLMQVHNLVDVNTHLDTLRGWKEEGRVRYLGITHYNVGAHDAVARIVASQPLDFIQINYSIGEREAETRLLPLALERGVAVIANRPFAGGELFRRLRSKPVPAWAAEIDCDTWAQLLLKFVVSHPSITCAIPATSKAGHVRENMKAGTGRLPDEKLRLRIAAEAA